MHAHARVYKHFCLYTLHDIFVHVHGSHFMLSMWVCMCVCYDGMCKHTHCDQRSAASKIIYTKATYGFLIDDFVGNNVIILFLGYYAWRIFAAACPQKDCFIAIWWGLLYYYFTRIALLLFDKDCFITILWWLLYYYLMRIALWSLV
jgi:hypothetical protein